MSDLVVCIPVHVDYYTTAKLVMGRLGQGADRAHSSSTPHQITSDRARLCTDDSVATVEGPCFGQHVTVTVPLPMMLASCCIDALTDDSRD